MAPSQVSIATSSLQRLVREEASYHKELQQQEERLKKLETETGDENQEYLVKQQKTAIQETKKLFPELDKKILAARTKLEDILKGDGVAEAEAIKANEVIESSKSISDKAN